MSVATPTTVQTGLNQRDQPEKCRKMSIATPTAVQTGLNQPEKCRKMSVATPKIERQV